MQGTRREEYSDVSGLGKKRSKLKYEGVENDGERRLMKVITAGGRVSPALTLRTRQHRSLSSKYSRLQGQSLVEKGQKQNWGVWLVWFVSSLEGPAMYRIL